MHRRLGSSEALDKAFWSLYADSISLAFRGVSPSSWQSLVCRQGRNRLVDMTRLPFFTYALSHPVVKRLVPAVEFAIPPWFFI